MWFDRLGTNGTIKIPFTLSRELAERSKGVLQEAPVIQNNLIPFPFVFLEDE
jgi:hypothetical protein